MTIKAEEPGTFAANNGAGRFEWDLTARGMRGDVDGYMSEFNPANAIYRTWYPAYKNVKMWRLVGNGFITFDQKKRLGMYKELQKILLDRAAAVTARGGDEVPGRAQARQEHVRGVQRLQHRSEDRVGRVTEALTPDDRSGGPRTCGVLRAF